MKTSEFFIIIYSGFLFESHSYKYISYTRRKQLSRLHLYGEQLSTSDRILNGLKSKFSEDDSKRIVDCFTRFVQGKDVDRLLGDGRSDHNRQVANCYVEGLELQPFHNPFDGKFEWTKGLEANVETVKEELELFLRKNQKKAQPDNDVWMAARNTAGHSYGPEWKTFGLQDRGVWDEENLQWFPKTVKLLKDTQTPSCEVFFARQGAESGILPHSDFNNFILTCHLGLKIPPNNDKAWIRVGDETRYWQQDKVLIFDTSIYHSTRNDAQTDRYVLLIRFWHPDLTPTEVAALSFIFDFLNHAAMGEAAMNRFEFEQLVQGNTKSIDNNVNGKKDKTKVNSPSRKGSNDLDITIGNSKKEKDKIGRPAKGFHRGA